MLGFFSIYFRQALHFAMNFMARVAVEAGGVGEQVEDVEVTPNRWGLLHQFQMDG
jgi:hypothetical protein